MTRRWPARARTIVGALVCLLVLVSWRFRFLDRGVHPALDLYLYFYPLYEATYGRLAQGILPLWNPYQLCGIPWLATLQGGFFYPAHALYLLLPLPVALALSHGAHLLLVGLATAAFARRLGLEWPAVVLASVLFTLRGFIPLSLGSANYLDAASWMPVGALGLVHVVRGRAAWGMALLGAATALSFLGGYPQPTVYMLYLWATLAPVLLVHEGADARRWLTAAAAIAAAVAVGVLAASIQLLTTLELIRTGGHLELRPEVMSPFGAVTPGMLILATAVTGSPFSYGVAALALAAVALLTPRHRALAWWAVALCIVSAVGALGPVTRFFDVYRAVPFLGMFRFPDRILSVTDFAFAIAAGIGIDALATSGRRGRMTAVGAIVVVATIAWMAGHGWAAPERVTHARLAALAAAALLVIALVRRPDAAIAAALVVLVTLDISLGPWTHRLTYGTAEIDAWRRYEATYRTVGERAGPDRVWFYGDVTIQPEFAQKLATRYRLHAIDDYEPLSPRRQDEYFTYFSEGAPRAERFPYLFAGSITTLVSPDGVPPPATRRRLLDLASLRWIVVPRGSLERRADIAAFLRDGGFEARPLAEADLMLWENPRALPRAYVVHRTAEAPPTAELLAALASESFDPLASSYVEGDPGVAATGDAPRGHPATIVEDGERVVEVEATLERPGLVVLGDAYYPGWTATIDGAPAPILATNHLFRGVAAPAGTHRVRFEYWPRSVALGAAGSIAGWLVIALLAWRGLMAHRMAGASGLTSTRAGW